MGKDDDGSLPDLDLNDWDPDDTYLAEKPNVSWKDLVPKKQPPRDSQVSEGEALKAKRWEHQLEDGAKPPIVRPATQKDGSPRPLPFEMLAGEVEDLIPKRPDIEDLADDDESAEDDELMEEDANTESEFESLEEEDDDEDEDEETFADSMAVLEKVLMLRKRQSLRKGRPAEAAELMKLAHETLEKLPINVTGRLDFIAEFVARVIDAEVPE